MSFDTIERRGVLWAGIAGIASAACGQGSAPLNGRDVREFGATGNGRDDDAPAIQRAIDTVAQNGGGSVIIPPGLYALRYRASDDGDGASALTLRSGVILEGADRKACILKLADDQMGPGAYARLVASRGEIVSAGLKRLTIDGNRQRQAGSDANTSGAGVLLGWKGRCLDVTVEALTIRNVVGQGIMLQGSIGNASRRLRIADNLVEHASYIGIQVSQFDGIEIIDNCVFDCADNGIDIYGDNTANHSTDATSHNAMIARNDIRRCSVGIFLETVADSAAVDNVIADCRAAGVRINRIHGEPRNLMVAGNTISGTPAGIAMGGETGGVVIKENIVRGFFRAGIDFGYNVSGVVVTRNQFYPATQTTPIVLGTPTATEVPPQRLLRIRIQDNHVTKGYEAAHLFENYYRSLVDVQIDRFTMDLN